MRNADVAEMLARAAEEFERGSTKRRALSRAAHAAMLWPVEVEDVVARGEPLLSLASVGPFVARILEGILAGEAPFARDPIREGFLAFSEVNQLLAESDLGESIRGDFQVHTLGSDGHATLDEMVDAAINRGYEYLAITDHTEGLKIANGMDEARFNEQHDLIDSRNDGFRAANTTFTILKGAEMNLDQSGEGDMSPSFMARFDLVLGAFHSKLRLKEDQTERYLAAVRNRSINVLAHPRTRMWGRRLGLMADWARVFEAAEKEDIAVEIDGHVSRQDLDAATLAAARETGVRVSMGSDAHHPAEMAFMDFAIAAAIKAGIAEDRIINTLPVAELIAWSHDRRA